MPRAKTVEGELERRKKIGKKLSEWWRVNKNTKKIKDRNRKISRSWIELDRKGHKGIKKRVKIKCDYCQKNIEKRPCEIKINKYNFCSRKCYHKFYKGITNSPDTLFKKGDINNQIKKARSALGIKPTKPEQITINLVKNKGFDYTGCGKFWIKYKNEIFNPDFINKDRKLIIEVFGKYWHSLPESKKRDKLRLKAYSKQGFNTLIIWDFELKSLKKVIKKINKFIGG